MIASMLNSYAIAPSIFAADFLKLGEAIQSAEEAGADWIHVDIMDGHFVPNLSMGPLFVEACRRATRLPLDVHLMVSDADAYLQPFADAGADSLSVHIEGGPHVHRTLSRIHELGKRAGIVLNPATPAVAIEEVLPMVDLVLVMTVNPGFSGQTFIASMLPKIRRIRDRIQNLGLKTRLEVDGGITAMTAPQAAAAGADTFVAASAVFKHPNGIQAGIEALRSALAPAAA